MPKIRLHPSFSGKLRKFTRRNKEKLRTVHDTLGRFQIDPHHPSLHLEKLSGSDTWTIRIDKGNRLFFVWSEEGDTAIIFYVGSHDAYRTVK